MATTLPIAFLAGFISFLSPCVLPLIPGYISYISGTSFEKLVKKEKNFVLIKTIFLTNSNILRIAAGIIIIFFSLQMLGIISLKFMNKDIRFFTGQYNHNLAFPFLVGAAFGFGWTPCIGPILGSILTLAAMEESISEGIILLLFYSLGLAIPFIISGILIDKFLLFSKKFRKNIIIITKSGGIILLLTGVAILTNQLQVLGFFILEYFPSLGKIG